MIEIQTWSEFPYMFSMDYQYLKMLYLIKMYIQISVGKQSTPPRVPYSNNWSKINMTT